MDGKKIKKLVIALILVILAGLAYLFLLRYSDKQKEAESQKEQEEAAASVVFETDTDEVSSISFSGDDGILTFEKKNDTWICPDDSVFQMNENKIQKLLADISSVSCTRELDARGDLAQFVDSPGEDTRGVSDFVVVSRYVVSDGDCDGLWVVIVGDYLFYFI